MLSITEDRFFCKISVFIIAVARTASGIVPFLCAVSIPVIGIGAGGGVDGQVLVIHDMLGINQDFSPKFLRRYADLAGIINEAIGHYIKDVKSGDFPNENEQY